MSLSRRVANTRRRRCQAACSSRPTRARTRRIPNDTAQARAELGRCLPHGATVGCELAIFRRTDLQEATISDVERREDERGFLACTWRSTGSTIPAAWPKSTNLVPAATGPRWCCTSPRQALVNRSVADSGELFATCATFRRCNGLEEVDRTHDVRGEAGSGVASVVCITSHKCPRVGMGYWENDLLGGVDPYSAGKACRELVAASYRDSQLQAASLRKQWDVSSRG